MRNLQTSEVEQVSGGPLPIGVYVATFLAAYGAAEIITDFAEGFSDALND